MASPAFPQLSGGVLAQYPIRKVSLIRTVKNILADGRVLVAADPGASRLLWRLSYADLPAVDVAALTSHFNACGGTLRAFTFLDPTENLLANSSNPAGPGWIVPPGVVIRGNLLDPLGGFGAFQITNTTAAAQEVSQTLPIPASYQYCFSLYISAGACSLIRRSPSDAQMSPASSFEWSRVVSSGRLNDSGVVFTAGIRIAAAESVSVFGPQLEPQFLPSRFRTTYSKGGVYLNAHWADQQLVFTPDGPNHFSTTIAIETSVSS